MTRSSMDVRHLNRKLSKKLKAKVNRAALSKQLLQTLIAKSLLKSRAIHPAVPLPWLALLMHHPIQIKPADSGSRNERKLFIGMLSRKLVERDVRALFLPYGGIEETVILRDSSGQSKGCGFVTFKDRHSAINAIKSMNHSQTMEGCSSPLVVKFADTRKDKGQKKLCKTLSDLLTANLCTYGTATPPPYCAMNETAPQPNFGTTFERRILQQQIAELATLAANSSQEISSANLQNYAALAGLANTAALSPAVMQNMAALAAAGNSNASGLSLSSQGTTSNSSSSLNGMSPVPNMALGLTTPSLGNLPGVKGITNKTALPHNGASLDALTQAYRSIQAYTAIPFPQLGLQALTPSMDGRQLEGPEGANLFIYHLPQEYTDTDLAQTFMAFGNVISAKVFIDKQTHLSKCFGFVSYDNQHSALTAIQAMHGFQIGMKRLKVQLKRSKDLNKPY